MRKLLLGLLLALTLLSPAQAENSVGPSNAILCNKLAIQAVSTTSLTTLVTGVAGQSINICGWSVTSSNAAAGTFLFSFGTGTNCGTTNNVFSAPFNVTSTAPAVDHTSTASISSSPGNNLCVISSSANLQIGVWYSQF